jgi:hypothetical protein
VDSWLRRNISHHPDHSIQETVPKECPNRRRVIPMALDWVWLFSMRADHSKYFLSFYADWLTEEVAGSFGDLVPR